MAPEDDPRQAEVIAFLGDAATHGGAPVERISTHGAHVFLAGDRAYKLKRAVKLPFLDFSTAEKRRAMLEAELRLNQATAPSIYREVRAISRGRDGHLRFGQGSSVDWVLVMRRFRQEDVLRAVARRGALDAGMIDALAVGVAAMHRTAPVERNPAQANFRAMAMDNIAVLRGDPEIGASLPKLERALAESLDALGDYLDRRAAAGFVRRCHGDLHLGNIVLIDGKPTPFDALEFDARLATGDVFYDLAFLLMDLDYCGLRPAANRLLNRYIEATDDLEGLRGLAVFLAVRAAIRAKVAVIRAEQEAAALKTASRRAAREYVDLALGYIPAAAPVLIGIGGLSGTGKSALALALAPRQRPAPGALVLRSDVFRKRIWGVKETDRLPPDAYARDVTARVYAALLLAAKRGLAAGHSAIVDAVFTDPRERNALESIARDLGQPFIGIWLEASVATRKHRVGTRTADASDADSLVVEAQEGYDTGDVGWRRWNADLDKDEIARLVSNYVEGRAGKWPPPIGEGAAAI